MAAAPLGTQLTREALQMSATAAFRSVSPLRCTRVPRITSHSCSGRVACLLCSTQGLLQAAQAVLACISASAAAAALASLCSSFLRGCGLQRRPCFAAGPGSSLPHRSGASSLCSSLARCLDLTDCALGATSASQ